MKMNQPDRIQRKGMYVLFLAGLLVCTAIPASSQAPKPPPNRKDNVKEVLHGVEVVDPYRWLEDQDSPETRSWIDAQNGYTESLLGKWPGRDHIKQRLTQLMKIDAMGTPTVRNGRYFFFKRRADQELFVIYMRKGPRGQDRVLLDPHSMSPDKTTTVSLLDISNDGRLIAYGTREGGQDEVTVNLMEVDSRRSLPDRLPKARYYGVSLTPDKSGFYYSRHTATGPRVYYHKMGSDPAKDPEIFGEGYGPEKIIGASLSEDGRYLLLEVFHGAGAHRSEVYIQEETKPGRIVPVVNDLDAMFSGQIAGDELFMLTNWEAPTWRILSVDLKNPARNRWREVIPASDSIIEEFSLAGGRLVAHVLDNVVSRARVYAPTGRHLRDIDLPAIGSMGGLRGQWKDHEAFFSFSSFHVPPTIYRYEVAKGTKEVWAQLDVPIDSGRMEVKQVWYESKDGTRVPMFLLHGKGLKLDGSHPTFLTGYGGFNVNLTPGFSSLAALWVENGGVFALPNLRGGGEFGETWHRAGMLEKKQNVFDDFIAAAQWLVRNGYTNSSKLAISGGSNGGLLVGAALTQRPDLFRAVVCSVPLLDMVRYHKFLVASFWVPEYGSSEDPEQFKYIQEYSPYHQVTMGTEYPAVLFISGDSDTRVAPLHARKMTALLQSATGSQRPILLHYDTKAGHSGGRPLSKQIDDLTDELSFLFWQLDVKPPEKQ